jgi:predicted ATP-dependent endonuclease of OLD family
VGAPNVTALPQRATINASAMIRSFGIRDFKGHRDTELELGRFTLLVGDNASGKTSVLDALAMQCAIVEDPFAFFLPGASLLPVTADTPAPASDAKLLT